MKLFVAATASLLLLGAPTCRAFSMVGPLYASSRTDEHAPTEASASSEEPPSHDEYSSQEEAEITYGRMDEDAASPFGHARRMAARALDRRTDSFYAHSHSRSFVNDWWDRSGRPHGYADPAMVDDEYYYYDDEENENEAGAYGDEERASVPKEERETEEENVPTMNNMNQHQQQPPQAQAAESPTSSNANTNNKDMRSESSDEAKNNNNMYNNHDRPTKDLFSMPPRMAEPDYAENQSSDEAAGRPTRDLFSMPPRQGRHRIMPDHEDNERYQPESARSNQGDYDEKQEHDDDQQQPRDLFSFPHRVVEESEYYDDNDTNYQPRDLFSMPPRQGSFYNEQDEGAAEAQSTATATATAAPESIQTEESSATTEPSVSDATSTNAAATASPPRRNYSPFGNKPSAPTDQGKQA